VWDLYGGEWKGGEVRGEEERNVEGSVWEYVLVMVE